MARFLFHQNMWKYGGANAAKNAAYTAGFARAAARVAAGNTIEVAGFTEVMNDQSTPVPLGGLVQQLNPLLQVQGIAACGRTAFMPSEFVAIAAPAGSVLGWGRVFLRVRGLGTKVHHDVSPANPPPAAWLAGLPGQATADYRGVVYVVCTVGGVTHVVGFVHNMSSFKDPLGLFMGRIADIVAAMRTHPAGGVNPPVFLGGDFNAYPYHRRARGKPTALQASANVTNTLAVYPGVQLGTTWGKNLYDYWYRSYVGMVPPVPTVFADGSTLDNNTMSDHASSLIAV